MIGEPDAGNLHVRFDEGMQETCVRVARLRPTLQRPRNKEVLFLFMILSEFWCANCADHI
jgi:hypothetical protein